MRSVRTAAWTAMVIALLAMSPRSITAQRLDATDELRAQLAAVTVKLAAAQARGGRTGGSAAPAGLGTDPMTGPVVTGAPFSADATTTVVQTLGDGTRIEQRASARFYRDSTGRVRRELMIIGLDALNPSAQARTVINFDSVPGDLLPYTLDPVGRTARRVAVGSLNNAFNAARLSAAANQMWLLPRGGPALERVNDLLAQTQQLTEAERAQLRELQRALTLAQSQGLETSEAMIPGGLKPTVEQLGARQIEGVKATGRRTTVIIPTDRVGNDRAMQITDERWESPELSLVVYSRFSDPRTGVIEYRLTNIRRAEPSSDLFQVPSDYTVIEGGGRRGGPVPVAEPGAAGAASVEGARGAGGRAGGRGRRSR